MQWELTGGLKMMTKRQAGGQDVVGLLPLQCPLLLLVGGPDLGSLHPRALGISQVCQGNYCGL